MKSRPTPDGPPVRDEPRRHPVFMILVGMAILFSSPFLFVGSDGVAVFGLPVWLWWSAGATVALSLLTFFGILRYWRDDSLE